MTRLPDTFNYRPIGYPRWVVLLTDHTGAPNGQLAAMFNGSHIGELRAKKIAQEISDALFAPVVVVREQRSGRVRRANPTLVHHGLSQGATYHVLSTHGAPFADLYFGNETIAKRVVQLIADHYGAPLVLAPNDDGGMYGRLSAAESRRRFPLDQPGGLLWQASTGARRNPDESGRPVVGETWRNRAGDNCVVRKVTGIRVWYFDRASGRELDETIGEFRATHKFVPRRQTNPRVSHRLKWSMYAGGSSAWEGAHGYDARTAWGQYTVDPVTTQYGRRAGYVVRFNVGGPGLLPLPAHMYQPGLYRDLGRERSPNAAKGIAQSHHDAVMAGVKDEATARLTGRQTNPRGRFNSPMPSINLPGGARIVHNKLLGGWYVVVGPHQTPISGRFNSKAEAQEWLTGRRRTNPCHERRHNPGCPCDGKCCSSRSGICECRCRGRNHGMSSGGHRPLFSNPGVTAEKERELVVRLLAQLGFVSLARDVMDLENTPREALEWLLSPGNRMLPESRKMIVRAALGVLTSGKGMTRGELDDFKRGAKAQAARERRRINPRRNPEGYAFSGTIRQLEPEQAPMPAPLELVKSPRARTRVRAARAPRAPRAPREVKPRLGYGMYVRAPYSGPVKAFGRTITKARETGTVVGLEDRNGEPWVRVHVPRGRSFTETWFPARQVRKVASKMRKPWQPLSGKHPRVWAALKREGGGDPARIRALLDNAVAEQAEVMERAQDLAPGRRTHEGADAFRRAYGDYVKARRRVEILEMLLQEVDPQTAKVEPWDANTDPWAPSAAISNPRNSAELERAMDTFEMWHEFPADRLTPVKVSSRRMPKHLVALGKVKRIDYESNKWEGRPVDYTHTTKRPYPILATDPEASALYLVGGKMKPTADGLVN